MRTLITISADFDGRVELTSGLALLFLDLREDSLTIRLELEQQQLRLQTRRHHSRKTTSVN